MNYKIAIVGTREITAGFAAIGFVPHNVTSSEEARELLFELKQLSQTSPQDNYAIVFVLEEFLKDLSQDDYQKISQGALPAIIPLPSHKGATGFGETKIRRIVEKAIGSDIFG